MHKYSIYNLMSEYTKNKDLIKAYLKKEPIEGFQRGSGAGEGMMVMGLSVGIFLLLFVLSVGLFIWAIWATIKYWNVLSDMAKVLLVLSWFFMPPLLPLIVVYVGKGMNS